MTRKPSDTEWTRARREVRRVDEDKASDPRPPSMTPAGSEPDEDGG